MKALISGITGMDGSNLAELLLGKGYEVHGILRRTSTSNTWRIDHILDKITIHDGDICDQVSLIKIMENCMPDEIYHLAAQSYVGGSWKTPIYTSECTGLGALKMLEAMRQACTDARYYQAGSSEQFGKVQETPQKETTPFYPRSPYGVAKCFAYDMTRNYRESYDTFCCSGIMFNHEGSSRGIEFVTRKITDGVARIKLGLLDKLKLGNLDAKRDWGFSGDFVVAMHMMLQNDNPVDYVVATGETHTVREWCKEAFSHVDLDYNDFVELDPKFIRPAEVDILVGDSSKIRRELGWMPKIGFKELVQLMVDADMKRWENGRH